LRTKYKDLTKGRAKYKKQLLKIDEIETEYETLNDTIQDVQPNNVFKEKEMVTSTDKVESMDTGDNNCEKVHEKENLSELVRRVVMREIDEVSKMIALQEKQKMD